MVDEPIYQWKQGWSYKVDPEVVANEIRAIERAWGKCTPELLVNRAQRDENHPLRSLFVWDDREAAHKYRVQQARRIIASVRIIVDEAPIPVPAFVHVRVDKTTDDGQKEDKYTSIMSAMQDPDARASVLGEALKVLQGYRKRYALLTELAGVWYQIDKAVEDHAREQKAA